jgi:hypothetical protein
MEFIVLAQVREQGLLWFNEKDFRAVTEPSRKVVDWIVYAPVVCANDDDSQPSRQRHR